MGLTNSKSKKNPKVESAKRTLKFISDPVSIDIAKDAASPAPAPVTQPMVNPVAVPDWINESQFLDILNQSMANFSRILSFSIKPAMGVGENYATLMLRVSIEAELTDTSTKALSLMMKVPHDTQQMEQLLQMGNFFDVENEAYIEVVPKLEELYKSKGLDVTFGPRAYRFTESLAREPKLKNTVVMYDLGQDGYKNVNRLECLNVEQSKIVLRKLAQYHAASAAYKSLHGPFTESIMYGIFGTDVQKAFLFLENSLRQGKQLFLENLKGFENCAQYHEKLEKYFSTLSQTFISLGVAKPDEFNVINHGDCWVNNFLFKYDDSGKLLDMLFVDFQNPRYCNPAGDLLYFIFTSIHIDYKLKDFDFFVKYYYDQLVEHLKLLEYKERVPKLVDLQMDTFKYGFFALMASFLVLPVVLLDPTETATFENLLGDTEAGAEFKNQMYRGKRYKQYIEQILPWLDNRGLLEAYEPSQVAEGIPAPVPASAPTPAVNGTDSIVPAWVDMEHFTELLKTQHSDFKEITDLKVKKATAGGDNYSSIMLSIDIDYLTGNGQMSSKSFMLKIPPSLGLNTAYLELMLTFRKEMAVYNDVIPQMEQLYKQAGHPVVFGPNSYELPNAPESDHILLENLRPAGYVNANRLEGLNVHETKKVLAKLALFHAASAQLYVTKGKYEDCLDKPIYKEAARPILVNKESLAYLEVIKEAVYGFKGSKVYGDKVAKILDNFFDLECAAGIYDENEFNCLNHGDCWTNNVMFKYNADGEVIDTLFVDFQRTCFNSPALDLYYFLLSSPALDIKLEQFDFFVRYYHSELTRNLELLKYPRHIPSLTELHTILLKHPLPAVTTVATVMSVVLLDPTSDANLDVMMDANESGMKFKRILFTNERYRKHAEAIYPWLNHRGLLDIEGEPSKSSEELSLDWLKFQNFADLIKAEEPLFEKIVEQSWASATKPGDNYGGSLLTVDIKVELKDKSQKNYSFMLKVEPDVPMDENSPFNMFPKELEVYEKFVPAFEQLYRWAGLSISFSPKSYRFNKSISKNYLLMDNMKASGFEMVDRKQGLDLDHTKLALKKLAQWHAASLKYKELNGPYPPKYNNGLICEDTRVVFEPKVESSLQSLLKYRHNYKGIEEYDSKLTNFCKNYFNNWIAHGKVDEQEFNVLNHGDMWINNMLFQHDQNGQVKEVSLIDHQLAKYGNPAQDLYYFLMTSPTLALKLEKFDYLIGWYHQNLIEHAELLKYSGFVPDLHQLHAILLKYPAYAAGSVIGTLTLCLAEPNEELNTELFVDGNDISGALLDHLYGNELYKKHFEHMMPWLNKRGLLD